MAVIQTRLTSDNKQHDEAFKKSRQQVYNYKKTTTQAKDSLLSFAKGGLGKLVPALGLATTALAGMEKAMRATQTTSDAFDRTMAQARAGVNYFFTSLSRGDFSGFLDGLKNITKAAKEAYNAMDDLQTVQLLTSSSSATYSAERSRLEAIIRDPKATIEDIKKAQSELTKLAKEEKDNLKIERQRADDAFRKLAGEIFAKYGLSVRDIRVYEQFIGSAKGYETYIKNHPTLSLINDEDLKQLRDAYVLVKNIETSINNVDVQNSRLNRIGTKSSSGGSGKEKKLTDKEQLEIENEYLKTLDREVIKYYALMETAKGVEKIKAKSTDIIEQEITLTDELTRANERYDASLQNILDTNKEYNEKLTEIFNLQLDTLESLGDSFSNLGNTFDLKGLNIAGIIAQAIANIVKGYSEASAQAGLYGPWAWAAFSASGLAQITSVISQIHSLSGYANGGIVGGNSYSGDRVLARVNSGEMILNGAQQSKLFSMLNTGSSTGNENVVFKISGNDLVGVLNNYNKKVGRVI